jgi:hypothetical protein
MLLSRKLLLLIILFVSLEKKNLFVDTKKYPILKLNCLCGPIGNVKNRIIFDHNVKSNTYIYDYLNYQRIRYNSLVDNTGSDFPKISNFSTTYSIHNNELFQIFKANLDFVNFYIYFPLKTSPKNNKIIYSNKPLSTYDGKLPFYGKSNEIRMFRELNSKFQNLVNDIDKKFEVTLETKMFPYFEEDFNTNTCMNFFTFINDLLNRFIDIKNNSEPKIEFIFKNLTDMIFMGNLKKNKDCFNFSNIKLEAELFVEKGILINKGEIENYNLSEDPYLIEKRNKLNPFERLHTIFENDDEHIDLDIDEKEENKFGKIVNKKINTRDLLLNIKKNAILNSSLKEGYLTFMEWLDNKPGIKVQRDIEQMLYDGLIFKVKEQYENTLFPDFGFSTLEKIGNTENWGITFSELSLENVCSIGRLDFTKVMKDHSPGYVKTKLKIELRNLLNEIDCFYSKNLNLIFNIPNKNLIKSNLIRTRNMLFRKFRFLTSFSGYLLKKIFKNPELLKTFPKIEISNTLKMNVDLNDLKEYLYEFLKSKFNYRGELHEISETFENKQLNNKNVLLGDLTSISLNDDDVLEDKPIPICKMIPLTVQITGYDANGEIKEYIENLDSEHFEEMNSHMNAGLMSSRRYII